MRLDEFEAALRQTAEDQPPPVADPDQLLSSWRADVSSKRRRRWLLATATLLLVGIAATIAVRNHEDVSVVLSTPDQTAGSAAQSTISQGDRIERADVEPTGPAASCFPALTASAEVGPVVQHDWPSDLAPLLVVTASGDVWVIDRTGSTRWNAGKHRYLWARWGEDGHVYASRHDAANAIAIDELSAPGQISRTIRLPYTIKPDAPSGVCPIDGYLATFTLDPDGLTLLKHAAGPLPISCPYGKGPNSPPTTEDPWRCNLKEGLGFEIRPTDFEQVGRPGNDFLSPSAASPLASDTEASSEVAIANFDVQPTRIRVLPMKPPSVCCSGNQSGSAFALSPDGQRVAYTPDGRSIRLEPTNQAADGPTATSAWTSPDAIEAIRWTKDDLVVAHGGRLTIVPTTGGTPIDLLTPNLRDVRMIDTRRAS